jgi:hypothetical protein
MQNTTDFTSLLWGPALSQHCPNSTTAIKPIIYTKPVLCLANTIPVQLFEKFLANPAAYLSPQHENGGVYAFFAFTILLQVKIFFFCHFYDLYFFCLKIITIGIILGIPWLIQKKGQERTGKQQRGTENGSGNGRKVNTKGFFLQRCGGTKRERQSYLCKKL